MRYAIISDIHGNLEAFEAVVSAISKERVDELFSPGDIVGYGANPVECIALAKKLNIKTVLGNNDAACNNLTDLDYFTERARNAVIWTLQKLSRSDMEFLKKLDLKFSNKYFSIVHGTLHEPQKFHYMTNSDVASDTFEIMKNPICFVGHSHIPGVAILSNGKITYVENQKIKLKNSEKLIVNAGSVGQPRDGDPRACYVIYDTDKKTIEFKRVKYDVAKAKKKILDAGLPASLGKRLEQGI